MLNFLPKVNIKLALANIIINIYLLNTISCNEISNFAQSFNSNNFNLNNNQQQVHYHNSNFTEDKQQTPRLLSLSHSPQSQIQPASITTSLEKFSNESYLHSHSNFNSDSITSFNTAAVENSQLSFDKFQSHLDDNIFNISEIEQSVKKKNRRSVCRISEFSCKGGKGQRKCLPSNLFCDGIDHCGDKEDEPDGCTPCNRTYYGESMHTYTLLISSSQSSVHRTFMEANKPFGRNKRPNLGNFICQLTFAAAGDNYGDIVQIIFDTFSVGHFSSYTNDGCQEGHLQVAEISRPITGGKWCGIGKAASSYAVYYSEMSAVALTLNIPSPSPLFRESTRYSPHNKQDNVTGSNKKGSLSDASPMSIIKSIVKADTTVISSSAQQQPIEFDFKIRYKFIPKSLAFVRYGIGSPLGTLGIIERGELVPGSYCSRVFDSCHIKNCKIQSPNYPGLYPRNLTCYFTIRQREIPPRKRILIKVSQQKPHKVQLRSIPTTSATNRLLQRPHQPPIQPVSPPEHSASADTYLVWEDCNGSRDEITVYDGTTTMDPVLLKFCGGLNFPPIISSGPEILVAFTSTPFGTFEPSAPSPFPPPLRGFELDVAVKVVDSESAQYTMNPYNCSFLFFSSKSAEDLLLKTEGGNIKSMVNLISGKTGMVYSPRHTLPQNRTCRYEFRGNKEEVIWIYYVTYRRGGNKDHIHRPFKKDGGNCTTRLRILDGLSERNEVLLGSYCDNDLPRLCVHKALQNESRVVRSCNPNESYISAGSRIIIEQTFQEGTSFNPLEYLFNYEFVDRHIGAEGCNRHFVSGKVKAKGTFSTSTNVFDFGRGGTTNITCHYTFYLRPAEILKLTLLNSSFSLASGKQMCVSPIDPETGNFVCNYNTEEGGAPFKSEVSIAESIWIFDANITSHPNCLCGNQSTGGGPLSPIVFKFLGRKVDIAFKLEGMNPEDSYENLYAKFNYEITDGGGCRGDNHYLRSESGSINLDASVLDTNKLIQGALVRERECSDYPWLIEARKGYSLYLRIPGFPMFIQASGETNASKYYHTGRDNSSIIRSDAIDGRIDAKQLYLYNKYGKKDGRKLRPCPQTKNRIFVYDEENKLIQKICPTSNDEVKKKTSHQTYEIFTKDFDQFKSPLFTYGPSRIKISFLRRELGSYTIKWLEVLNPKKKHLILDLSKDMNEAQDKKNMLKKMNRIFKEMFEEGDENSFKRPDFFEKDEGKDFLDSSKITDDDPYKEASKMNQSEFCKFFCPELNACISETLWCNGEPNCPISQADESKCDSLWLTLNQFMSPAVYIPLVASLTSALFCCFLVLACLALKRLFIKKKYIGSGSRFGTGTSAHNSLCSTMDSQYRGNIPPPIRRDYLEGPS